jgi:hypothetical protein
MGSLESWVTFTDEQVGKHLLRHMVPAQDDVSAGVEWAAAVIPDEYASPDRIARIFERLGKSAAADYLKNKLPTSKTARSGDLGEIIGARFAEGELGYPTVSRLRWKDHREMAMRGDDIIGVRMPETGPIEFLKGEVKSRASLDTDTVEAADLALRSDNGLPSSHALAFIADRLHEQGDDALADKIDDAQLVHSITEQQVVQLLFTFTGSNPRNLLRTNTKAYREAVRRLAVGLEIRRHQAFVADVYAKVIADA